MVLVDRCDETTQKSRSTTITTTLASPHFVFARMHPFVSQGFALGCCNRNVRIQLLISNQEQPKQLNEGRRHGKQTNLTFKCTYVCNKRYFLEVEDSHSFARWLPFTVAY